MTSRRQIKDREPPVANPDVVLDPMPLAIRAAMRDGVGHALEEPRRNRMAIGVDDPGDAAHGSLPLYCMIMMRVAAPAGLSERDFLPVRLQAWSTKTLF